MALVPALHKAVLGGQKMRQVWILMDDDKPEITVGKYDKGHDTKRGVALAVETPRAPPIFWTACAPGATF